MTLEKIIMVPIDSAHRLKCSVCYADIFFVASEAEGKIFSGAIGVVECTNCHKEYRLEIQRAPTEEEAEYKGSGR